MSEGQPLFDEVVARSRLNPVVAPFTITRILVRADLRPERLTPAQLAEVLPRLEEGLAVYLRGEDLDGAVADLRALAAA